MNARQTRPLRQRARRADFALLLWPLAGVLGCHTAARAEPDSHSPRLEAAASSVSAESALSAPSSSSTPSAASAPAASNTAPPNIHELAAAGKDAGAPAADPHRYVVAAVGDSLTDPRSHGGGYLEYVKARCPNLELDNFGRGATMVNQMRSSFDEQIAASPKPYTHLVVFGGVNDLYSDLTAHRTPAKIEADLDYMYSAAKARGMKVVALTVAPWGGFTRYFNASRAEATHAVNDWIRAQPAHGHVDAVIDAYELLSCGEPDVLCERFVAPFKDGIHFGRDGHRLLGEALYQAVFSDCR